MFEGFADQVPDSSELIQSTAERIFDLAGGLTLGTEFPEAYDGSGRARVPTQQVFFMLGSHDDDREGIYEEFIGYCAGAMIFEIDAGLLESPDGIRVGGVIFDSQGSGRVDCEGVSVRGASRCEQRLGHGGAADVAAADKDDLSFRVHVPGV